MSLVPLPSLDTLAAHPANARDLPPEAARAMLFQLAPLVEALRLQALNVARDGQPEDPAPVRLAQPAAPRELPGPDVQAGRKPMPDVARTSLLSVREAAKMLSCSEAAVRKWVYRRQLHAVKLGRLTRLRVTDVEAFIARGARPARGDRP